MASLGQLVAGIAHEINNPLAFVMNNLFIAESGLSELNPEMEPHLAEPSLIKLRKVLERLSEMGEGLDRVKELVLDLRTFSRLDEGQFKTVDIAEKIDAVVLLLKHKMDGRMLYCSPGRLRQVLTNLIANAADAIAGEGKIVISTSQTSEDFTISIRDTGAGIPAAIRSRIFDPFFTTKEVGRGTGLGLAISYGIVQDHGGSIEVESEEGIGTEFMVKIPLDLESRKAKSWKSC
jgi:two-component system NtrC family sensor kinase